MPAKALIVPARLVAACRVSPERETWLVHLPFLVRELADRWALTLAAPFDSDEVSCAWVAEATRADGTSAVLKVGMPHMEGAHEISALRFWAGDPTVRLLDADDARNAMLLERCRPGTHLRRLPEPDQDIVIAGLLRRLWRSPPPDGSFRSLSTLMALWSDETEAAVDRWPDVGLVRSGLELLRELSTVAATGVVLATDLHAGNVLRAQREPWLVIDPKPFVGDAAFDATQHLLNCRPRLLAHPTETIRRFADLLAVDFNRVRLWTFARAAAQPRNDWTTDLFALARAIAP